MHDTAWLYLNEKYAFVIIIAGIFAVVVICWQILQQLSQINDNIHACRAVFEETFTLKQIGKQILITARENNTPYPVDPDKPDKPED